MTASTAPNNMYVPLWGFRVIHNLVSKIRSVKLDSDRAGRQNHSLWSFILAPIPTTSHTRTLGAKEMRQILLLNIFLLIISCNDKGDKPINQERVDKPQEVIQEPIDKPIDRPTRNFGVIVRMLDSLGYRSDTARVAKLKNYKELLDSEVQRFGTFPFYRVDKEKSKVLWWNTIARDKTDSIDTEIFRKAENVWSYYYQKEESKNLKTDGVIEQWMFQDSVTAQTAMEKLKTIYPLPYFNTQPYYIADGQYLFIFHTRANAFSYRQKNFFNKFREISSAPNTSYKSLPGLE
jgi:hypothetical protein